ncbi:CYFA0S10e00474g1_1 [Cyberlindnera fabianii]|uniref:CYFA0S10e00474g1_1 n=1 Tax=Cyberlindnera fabianii TaxID=36022 RepID=A0A061B4Q3_CYBFA|nr:CYFA0S10e00474g1_1 [Cyberlindnera fabianii]
MAHTHGYRRRTRYKFARDFKKHGAPGLTTYLHTYKKGDIVDIKANGAIQKGLPHYFYHGRTGVVFDVTRSAVGVLLYKIVGNRYIEKRIHVGVEHVKHSDSRLEFLRRVKSNSQKRKEAKEKGITVQLKREPGNPRPAHVVETKNNPVITLAPQPYETFI